MRRVTLIATAPVLLLLLGSGCVHSPRLEPDVGRRLGWTVISMRNDWSTVFREHVLGGEKIDAMLADPLNPVKPDITPMPGSPAADAGVVIGEHDLTHQSVQRHPAFHRVAVVAKGLDPVSKTAGLHFFYNYRYRLGSLGLEQR